MLARFRSPDSRLKAVLSARAAYESHLEGDGLRVFDAGVDPAWLQEARGKLRAWIFSYDPDLFPFLIVHAHLYTPGSGFERVGAYLNASFENDPEDRIHVLDLQIDPATRRHGVGTHLMQAVIDHADLGGLAVYGELSEVDDVDRLGEFYRRLGFEVMLLRQSSDLFVGEIHRAPAVTGSKVDGQSY